MSKKFTDELEQWTKKRKAPRRDKYKVEFIAVRDDVKSALDAGYAIKIIWELLHEKGKITYSYGSFLKHVNLYITEKGQKQFGAVKDSKQKTPIQHENKNIVSKEKEQKPSGFKFNPKPNKEDLF